MKDEMFLTDDSENQRERERIEAGWELGRKAYKGPRTRDIVDMFCDDGLPPEEALWHERQELAREFREAVEAAKKQMTFLCTDSCAGRVETTLHSPQGNFEALSNPGARGLLLTWAQCESRARGLRTKVCGKGATPEQEPDITR